MKNVMCVGTMVVLMVLAVSMSARASVIITSNGIQMNVTDAVVITVQPVGYNLYEMEDIMLSVTAVGSPIITYQWRKDGIDIGGETNDTLTIASALASDSAIAPGYECVVANGLGSVTSAPAIVNVYTQPTVVLSVLPADILGILDIASGDNAEYTLTVTPAGTNPAPSAGTVTIQWLKDAAPVIPDLHAVLSTIILPDDTLTFTGLLLGDTGFYECVVVCTAP